MCGLLVFSAHTCEEFNLLSYIHFSMGEFSPEKHFTVFISICLSLTIEYYPFLLLIFIPFISKNTFPFSKNVIHSIPTKEAGADRIAPVLVLVKETESQRHCDSPEISSLPR